MKTLQNTTAPAFRYVIEYANGASNEKKANFSGIGRALEYGRILLDRPTAEAVQIYTPNGQVVEIEKGRTGCPTIRRADKPANASAESKPAPILAAAFFLLSLTIGTSHEAAEIVTNDPAAVFAQVAEAGETLTAFALEEIPTPDELPADDVPALL